MYWTRWVAASTAAACIATAADSALLQRSRSYFGGGFLAADALDSAASVIGFLTASLLSDVAVAGAITAVVLWACSRRGVKGSTAFALGVGAALVPIALADFVEYELASYLGDAFNATLLFDLTGRSVSEMLAVGSQHVTAALFVGALALGVVLWLVIAAVRRGDQSPWSGHPSLRTALLAAMALVLVAASVTAVVRRGSDQLDNGLRRKPSGQWLGTLVNRLSDFDRDGYGLLGRPPDLALFDSRVRPYALDLPGNGVDEDGVAGDLPAGIPSYHEDASAAPTFQRHPDVILFVLESFRADVVGAQVNGRAVTPVIDRLASQGVSSSAAYSHNGYTVQARHHIFSGSLADLRGGTSLIDDFKANGYEIAYFSGQDESFGGPEYAVGFDRADVAYDARADLSKRYTVYSTAGSLAVPHTLLVQRVTEFLERRQPSKPLFLYVNFHDTHFPYHHGGIEPLLSNKPLRQADISAARGPELRATYLNTAANVDRAIGRVLEAARRHLPEQAGVLVTADHGESLFDEGFLGHGYALNDAQTRVPFVVTNLPAVVHEPVGQADIRDMLRAALTTAGHERNPRIAIGAPPVFQYLGALERPAQIAFTARDSQLAYDLRAQRVRVDRGEWIQPSRLSPAAATRWRDLVTTWERMMLARVQRPSGA